MTPREFVQPEQSNSVKAAVHGAMLVGAVACCLYNGAAYYYRRETHNGVNAVVYGLLIALEVVNVQHHRSVMGTPTSVTDEG